MPIRLCSECRAARATMRGKCIDCYREQERNRSAERRARQSFYASKPWRMTRRRHLAEHPLCEYLIDGKPCDRIATVVHHHVDLAAGGAPRDHGNLVSPCKPHHDSITANRMHNG